MADTAKLNDLKSTLQLFRIRKNSDLDYVRRCLHYFKEDKVPIVLLVTVVSLSILSGILQAWPLAVMLDSVLVPDGSQQSLNSPLHPHPA
jgi:hypothetical protein